MKYVEVVVNTRSSATVQAIAEQAKAVDFRLGVIGEDGMRQMRMLVADSRLQSVLDALQNVLGAHPTARIVVLPVEAALPRDDNGDNNNKKKRSKKESTTTARESLYEDVEINARLNVDFVVLVVLSTVVAAIGLIEDNIAVVIGAMVIAPLLGPNLALSLGTALGDGDLVRKSARTLFVGIILAVYLSALLGLLWPSDLTSVELMARTEAGLESIVLALASGAAAALSLSVGLSSVLVGVMVAVALLPPAATLGIMMGDVRADLAIGAGLLLVTNIVCINLASKIVFYAKGVHPRTWSEKEKARKSMRVYVTGWIVTLLLLTLIILARQSLIV